MEPAGVRKEWCVVPDSSLRSNGAEVGPRRRSDPPTAQKPYSSHHHPISLPALACVPCLLARVLVSAHGNVGDDRFWVLWAREGAGGLDGFYAITKLSDDILQQRLQSVV